MYSERVGGGRSDLLCRASAFFGGTKNGSAAAEQKSQHPSRMQSKKLTARMQSESERTLSYELVLYYLEVLPWLSHVTYFPNFPGHTFPKNM